MKCYFKLICILLSFSSISYAQNTKLWGSLNLKDNSNVELLLNSISNTEYSNRVLVQNTSGNELNYLFLRKNGILVNTASASLDYATLFQTYLKIKSTDFYLPNNRSIKPTETPTYGTLSDNDNKFYIRLPFSGGLDEINNNKLLGGTTFFTRGIQDQSFRRKLWKEVFLSAIIQSEILSNELLGYTNTTYQENAVSKILNINNQVATGTDVLSQSKDIAECINSLTNIAIKPGTYGSTNIQDFLINFRTKIPDEKFSNAIHDLSIALEALSIGVEINSIVLKTYLLKTLQTAEADHRLETIESWIYSSSPGYNDSEILNGFEDAKKEYSQIREQTWIAIGAAIINNPSTFLLSGASIVLEETSKYFFDNYYKYYGVKLPFVNGIIATSTALINLVYDVDEEYDVLRLASIAATLEEYLSHYLYSNYSNINASEISIRSKSCLAQINSFLGYFYFTQIRQVYDNKWYSNFGMFLLTNASFNDNGVTKEMLMSYCNEGISRNIEFFKQYSEPYYCAKTEVIWFNNLIENYYSYISKPSLSNGKVTPIAGTTTDNFLFSVSYVDPNPNSAPPSIVRVIIDGNGYSMTKDPSDNNFTDGVVYTYSRTFATSKTYSYSFSAINSIGNALSPFPESGTLDLHVNQSTAGWEASISPLNTNYSPASVTKGTTITVNTEVRNSGLYTYSNIPVRVEMRNSQGILVAYCETGTGSIAVGSGKIVNCQVTVPTNGIDGNYTLASLIFPSLDTDYNNNSHANSFYIGENLGNEIFRCNGLELPDNHTDWYINGKKFYIYGMNNSGTKYVTLRDPSGDLDKVYERRCKVYSSFDSFVACDIVDSDGWAALYGGYAILNGPKFDNPELSGSPGSAIYAYANVAANSGDLFESHASNYELYSSTTTDIKPWYNTLSKEGTFGRIKIRFDIPANAPLGKTVFYFRAEYSNRSYYDFIRLTVYVTNPSPVISSLSKTSISADDIITITGTNLGTSGTVKFGEIPSANVTSWSETTIMCTVPQGITNSQVTVTNPNGTSNGLAYTVISSTGSPVLIYQIPDQTMSQNETKYIGNLNDFFNDPNNGSLSFTATSNNTEISITSSELSQNNLYLVASANLLSNSTITVTATDNSGKYVSDSFVIFAAKVLKVSPPSTFIESTSGTTTFTLTSNIDWAASESSDWLTAVKTNATTLTVTYNKNSSVDSRSAIITISGTGVTSQVVTVNQSGATPALSVSPSSRSVSSTSGTTTFAVTSNIDWAVSESSDWLTAVKTNSTTLTVTYNQNSSVDSHLANITLSGTGVTSQVVIVTQSGATPALSVYPSSGSVSSASGTTTFTVTSNIDWTVSENSDWLTAIKTNATTLTVTYNENSGNDNRSANITLSGTGVTSQVVTVNQSGATPALSVSPSSGSVSSASGTTTFTITSNIDWTVSENSDWLTAIKTNSTTLTVTYNENSGNDNRSANITLSGTGVTSQVVTVNQSGATPALSVYPSSGSVSSASGTTTFTVTSNIDWTVSENSDWLTAIKTNATTLTVTYNENSGNENRSANITLSGTGVTSQVVIVTQSGATPALSVYPSSGSVSSASGTITFTVTSNIDWYVSESSDWLTAVKTNATTLIVTYNENSSDDNRSANITLSGSGVIPMVISILQDKGIANSIIDILDSSKIKIYPNPTSDKLYILSSSDIRSEILIKLYDSSGQLIYSDSVERLSAEERIEVSTNSLKCGIYFLQLNSKKSCRIEKIIKQ